MTPTPTIQEQIENLLFKRYKLVIRYPHYPFDGDVLIVNDGGELFHETEGYPQSIYKIMEKDIKDNPCFRLMEWHQERAKSEMPKYVKWTNPGTKEISFFEVVQWLTNSAGIYTAGTRDAYLFIKDILPATHEEYLTYINSKS